MKSKTVVETFEKKIITTNRSNPRIKFCQKCSEWAQFTITRRKRDHTISWS